MRRLAPFAVLALAACSTTPRPAPAPTPAPVAAAPQSPRTGLSGLGQAELVTRFGTPALTIREGSGLVLQWQNTSCVLDAFLYPGAAGTVAVTHVDARRPGSGETVPVETCSASLAAR